MATASATSQAAGIVSFATGSYTSDNTATVVTLGFNARYVLMHNSTDTITWQKLEGMAAANTIKDVSGTKTTDTGSAILLNTDKTITISSTAGGNAKAISWAAWA